MVRKPYDEKAKPPAAADMRCPACSATETLHGRPLLAWWSDGSRVYAYVVGQLVVCLRCDQPFAVTPAGAILKRLPKVQQAAQGHQRREADPTRDLAAAVASLPPEP